MILSCQACGTRYLVDANALGPTGRTVRCANCAHQWHQMPVEDGGSSGDFPTVMTSLDIDRLRPSQSLTVKPAQKSRRLGGLIWILLILLVVGIVAGALLERRQIAAAWPPAARLYAALGMSMEQSGFGLEIRNITTARTKKEGVQALVVGGEVINTSNSIRPVPRLRVILRSANDHELQATAVSPARDQLMPGEATPFETTITNPPPEASAASVVFATAE